MYSVTWFLLVTSTGTELVDFPKSTTGSFFAIFPALSAEKILFEVPVLLKIDQRICRVEDVEDEI